MIKYSASRIKTYDLCHLKYKNKYIDKIRIKQPITPEVEFGQYFHKVAEIYNGKNFIEIIKESKKYQLDKNNVSTLIKAINNYKRFYDKYNKLHFETEKRIEFADNNFWLYGFIDRLMKFKNGYIIVDYKTSKTINRDRFIFQIKLYNLILSKMFNIDPSLIKIILYYPVLDYEDKILLTNAEIKIFEDEVKNKINKIELESNWDPKPSFLCKWCEYKNTVHCPIDFKETLNG